MKKLLSALLSLLIIFSCSLPVFAEENDNGDPFVTQYYFSDVPTIAIFGDGEAIVNGKGETVFKFNQLAKQLGDFAKKNLVPTLFKMIIPFYNEGLLFGKWDNYFDAIEEGFSGIFAEARLDKNGERWNDTDISEEAKLRTSDPLTREYDENSKYSYAQFTFQYDWRLDPMENADYLREYVLAVKKATGHKKIAINAKCLGNCVLNAYLSKYGSKDLTGVGFAATVYNGAELISDPIGGKLQIDGNAVGRLMDDLNDLGKANISPIIVKTVELLADSGILNGIIESFRLTAYDDVVEGVTSSMALATFFTWPAYWACVSDEDYPTALEYVFGPEGSEKRAEYAGLLEKLESYKVNVRDKRDEIIKELKESGTNICIISKYGRQIIPVGESKDEIGDQFASVKNSSYGATTGTVYDPLSDEYISERVAEGKGKYISPDRQIDASTCAFPDYTWFLKGVSHSDYPNIENNIMLKVTTAKKQLTVDDLPYSQFITLKPIKDTIIDISSYHGSYYYSAEKMTEENCKTEVWNINKDYDMPKGILARIKSAADSFGAWFKELREIIEK